MTEDNERLESITKFISSFDYSHEKQFSNWYRHLKSQLRFPFEGMWKRTIGVEPVKVRIVGICDFEICLVNFDILIKMEYQEEVSDKPLFEIIEVSSDSKTKKAVQDWQFWIKSEHWMEK